MKSIEVNLIRPKIEDGYSQELIDYAEKIIHEHPTIGVEGKISMNYTGATYTFDEKEYAVFLLINRTSMIVDSNLGFYLRWGYSGQKVFNKQPIFYNHDSRGDLGINQACLMMLEITPDQKIIVDQMNDPNKMELEIIA